MTKTVLQGRRRGRERDGDWRGVDATAHVAVSLYNRERDVAHTHTGTNHLN